MTGAGRVGSALTIAVMGLALAVPAPAFSSADHSDAVATPTPRPKVDGKKSKWGASLSAKRKNQLAREKRESPRGSAEHNPLRHRPGRSLTKPQSISRRPFRLNIGVCGQVGADGTFPGPTRCQPFEADGPVQPQPSVRGVVVQVALPQDVRWEQVLGEYKDVLFPKLGVKVQPDGRTLVNAETIVYTDQSKVSVNTVELLGFPVVVEATPLSYTWVFGDGVSVTTESPGKPYPAKDVTHRYLNRGAANVSVTTNYAARFNVDGTGWQYVDGTVGITGPATPLLIREAVPVLVEPPR